MARRGKAGRGEAGISFFDFWPGMAWSGLAWQGGARPGAARRGEAGILLVI